MAMIWMWTILSVIRMSLADTVTLLIPEDDRFSLSIQVLVGETLWQDSSRFVYQYVVVNLSTSEQPLGHLTIGGFSPFGDVPWNIDTVWIEEVEMLSLNNSNVSSWGFRNFSPGDTLHAQLVSPLLPDVAFWKAWGIDSILFPTVTGVSEGTSLDVVIDSILNAVYFSKTPFGGGKYGHTVGPGPLPPSTPDSMFLHLLERVKVGHDLGWMSERAFRRLDSMIRHAYTQSYNFTAFDPVRGARNMNQIVRTIERLHNQGEIEDRAFYVLYYRARYVHQKFQEMIPQGKE